MHIVWVDHAAAVAVSFACVLMMSLAKLKSSTSPEIGAEMKDTPLRIFREDARMREAALEGHADNE
jgi:hypothetical protein